jgi:hypothetical protein
MLVQRQIGSLIALEVLKMRRWDSEDPFTDIKGRTLNRCIQ